MKKDSESALYPVVAQWLKRHRHCFKTDMNTGLRFSRLDVVGVRDVVADLSGEVETISVEVKKGSTPFATASGQASGYRVYANLVYLAGARARSFSPEEIDIVSHLGIGLIQISGRECREVPSGPYYKPIMRMNLLLLEKLALGHCRLCGCFFEMGAKNRCFSNLAREDIGKAIDRGKGLMFWNSIVGER